jgi:hypothetical protein
MKSFGSYCWVSYDWNVCNTRSANAFFTYKDCIGAGHLGRSLQCWQVSATERSLPSFKTCADTEVGWGAQTLRWFGGAVLHMWRRCCVRRSLLLHPVRTE